MPPPILLNKRCFLMRIATSKVNMFVVIRVRTPQFVIRARPRVRPGPIAITGRSPPPPRVRPLAIGSVIVGCFRLFRG